MFYTTASTATTYTFTNVTTAATGFILTFTTSPVSDPKKTSKPAPPPLRSGDAVRVTCEGILHNRVGSVSGFMEVPGKRITFVSWPGGGRTAVAERDLQRVGKKK